MQIQAINISQSSVSNKGRLPLTLLDAKLNHVKLPLLLIKNGYI